MTLLRKLSLPALVATILLAACQKEASQSEPKNGPANELRLSGVLEDDPALVSKIPMMISSDFLKNGNSGSSIVLLGKGKPDKTLPTVSINSPSNGSAITGTVNVQATASDNVGVSLVSLSIDGVLVSGISTAPYIIPWNSATVSNGTHTLTVTAKDAAGNSKAVSIQVSANNVSGGDITNPTVGITSPANSAAVSGTVNITANASDNMAVSLVKFIVDGAQVGSDNSSPYSFSWNTTTVAAGAHIITATAIDAAGNAASNSIQVTVNTTVIPPTPIPASFQLITPPAGNQGNEWSCVTFAIGYAARSIEQYYKTNATSYSLNSNIFSPEFVYNQTKFSDCGSGTAITLVLDLIKDQGVSTWQSMPYSDVNGCSLQPSAAQTTNASNYKISSYVTIPNADQVAIKTMIASKHPVITTVIMDNSFVNAGPGFIWKTDSGSGSLPHTIIICGYDDSKHAYKVMNSWGTAWGDAGFSWIDYDFFTQKSSYYTYAIQ
jgi:archaellum component FlaF (FlaF/FlaG flagellin family)